MRYGFGKSRKGESLSEYLVRHKAHPTLTPAHERGKMTVAEAKELGTMPPDDDPIYDRGEGIGLMLDKEASKTQGKQASTTDQAQLTGQAITDLPLIMQAVAFATDKHRGQIRKDADKTPYIAHPLALATVLWNEGEIRDAQIIAAALLHDTIEDTATTHDELEAQFGREVADLVADVTDDKRLPNQDRKLRQIQHAAHLLPKARPVKLADKICNLRDVAERPPANWSLDRRREYFDWAKKVVDKLRGSEPRLEAIFDETYKMRP